MKNSMEKDEFRCAACGNIYKKGWSDDEMMKESADIWGRIPEEDGILICDDCFNKRSGKEVREMGDDYKKMIIQ